MSKYKIPFNYPPGSTEQEIARSRTKAHWSRHEEKWMKRFFTKRMQQDLQQISLPSKMPAFNLWAGQGLYLHGDTGAGKTILSAQLMLDVKKHLWLNYQHKELKFISIPEMLGRLKRSFNQPEEDQYDIIDNLQQTWFLVMDDLGVSGRPSDWLLETMYLIINHRYENMLPTVITSNLDLNNLAQLYGDDRITSRIDRMCKIVHKKPWHQT